MGVLCGFVRIHHVRRYNAANTLRCTRRRQRLKSTYSITAIRVGGGVLGVGRGGRGGGGGGGAGGGAGGGGGGGGGYSTGIAHRVLARSSDVTFYGVRFRRRRRRGNVLIGVELVQ